MVQLSTIYYDKFKEWQNNTNNVDKTFFVSTNITDRESNYNNGFISNNKYYTNDLLDDRILDRVKEFYAAFNQEKYINNKDITQERLDLRKKLLFEEINEYIRAFNRFDRVEMLDGLCDVVYIGVGTYLELYGYDETLNRLDRFITQDNPLVKLVGYLFDLLGIDRFTFYRAFEEVHKSNMSKLENGRAIFREDGKIMKGKNYFRPNLKQFID